MGKTEESEGERGDGRMDGRTTVGEVLWPRESMLGTDAI